MALAIAWRNPNPVHTTSRCIKFGTNTPSDLYLLQELIAGAYEAEWASMSVLEVLCVGDVEASRVPDHTSNGSRAAGAKSHEPAAN
jgi:hypothetical protein